MAASHTPGPWHRNIPPASKYPTVWSGRNTHVAAICPGAPRRSGNGCSMSEEEQEANINLIAAAPELLAALRLLEQRVLANGEWDDGCFYHRGTSAPELQEPLALARAAIAKTGAAQ